MGQSERKAIAMSLVDRALALAGVGRRLYRRPAQDEEFVLMHCDNIQATGFLEHIKLPHYVDFQAELELVRKLRAEARRCGGGGMTLVPAPAAVSVPVAVAPVFLIPPVARIVPRTAGRAVNLDPDVSRCRHGSAKRGVGASGNAREAKGRSLRPPRQGSPLDRVGVKPPTVCRVPAEHGQVPFPRGLNV